MAVSSSIGPGSSNDFEEIYYSVDGGVNILLGWRRWKTEVDGSLSSSIVDDSGVVIVGAIEYPPPASSTGALTNTQLRASPVVVSGPATDAELRATPLPVTGSFTVTGALTDAQIRATPLPVSGSISVNNFPGTQAVTGPLTDTQLRATPVPVNGTVTVANPSLTDTELRATPVPVSSNQTIGTAAFSKITDGTNTVTVKGASTAPIATDSAIVVTISPNSPSSSGGLTDTQLRALPVPVSGTIIATGPLTDTQLRATAVPVSGTLAVTGPLTDAQLRASAIPVTGPLTDTQLRASSLAVTASQTIGSALFSKLTDGTNTATVKAASTAPISTDTALVVAISPNTPISTNGLTDTQLRATPIPVSGTVTVNGPTAVTGPLTDTQLRASAVPVSGTVTALGPLTDTQLRATAVPVSFTTTAATANFEKITDGTNTASVKGASTAPIATDSALVVTISPNSPATPIGLTDIQLRATAVPVSGTVTVGNASLAVTGPLTDTQLRATPVPVSGSVTATGPLTDTQLRATPVPISGNVTVNTGLTNAELRATAVPVVSNQTIGTSGFERITDGTNIAAVKAASTAAVATDPALVVSLSPNSVPNNTIATSAFTQITNGTINATIKAASTAAVAADPSLVVSISPNNPVTTAPAAFTTLTDVASAALTTTTTTAAVTPTNGNSYIVAIPVTVASGTTPTLDINIEESDDSGTNWFVVYSFPRITATGISRSPKLPYSGNRIRYVQTVTGTTPSFTRSIIRNQYTDIPDSFRQIIDRTIVLNTLNTVSPSLNTRNTKNIQVVVSISAATTNPSVVFEGSDDNGLSWYGLSGTLIVAGAGVWQLTVNNFQTTLARVRVSVAGAGVTMNYTLLKAW